MTTTLTQARTRTLLLLDDADGVRYNATNDFAAVDAALATAQLEAWTLAISSGSNVFSQEGAVSTAQSGAADLTTLKPIKISTVSLSTSTYRQTVQPVRLDEGVMNITGITPLLILYTPNVVFPVSGAANFVWGQASSTAVAVLDQLLCMIAAQDLLVVAGYENPQLTTRTEQLKVVLAKSINIPGATAMPMRSANWGSSARRWGGGNAWMRYVMTAPYTLQLVR